MCVFFSCSFIVDEMWYDPVFHWSLNYASILDRFNSWSRINITLEMFKALCTFDQVMPRFLNLISGFGRKTKSTDEDYMVYYRQFSDRGEAVIEACKDNDKGKEDCPERDRRPASYGQCFLYPPLEGFVSCPTLRCEAPTKCAFDGFDGLARRF